MQSVSIFRLRFIRALSALFLTVSAGSVTQTYAEGFAQTVELAAQHDFEWAAVKLDHEAQKMQLDQTRATLLPEITFAAETSRTRTELKGLSDDGSDNSRSESSDSYAASLTQSLYNGDEWYAWKGAKAFDEQLDYELQVSQENFWLRIAEHYFNLLKAQAELAFRVAEKTAISRQLDQTQQRFEVGLIAITDVHEAKAVFDLSVADLLFAKNELAIHSEALNRLTNSEFEVLNSVDAEFTPVQLGLSTADWLKVAQEKNAQLNIARISKDIAHYEKKSQFLAFGPTIDLIASYRSNPASQFGQSGEIITRKVGVQLTIPIFRGGHQRATYKAAAFNYEKSQADISHQLKQTLQDTTTRYRQLKTDALRINARKQAIVSATSALEATQAGYEVGTRNIVDLLDAQRRLFSAQRDLSHSQLDYLLHYLEFKQTTGELDQSVINRLDQWMDQAVALSLN